MLLVLVMLILTAQFKEAKASEEIGSRRRCNSGCLRITE